MSNNIIKLNRGDTYSLEYSIPNNNSTYYLGIDEALYFAIMYPHQRFEEAILLYGYTHEDQNVDNGTFTIKIPASVSRNLAPGIYYYTIKLKRGGNLESLNDYDDPIELRTLVERTKLIINE